MSQAVASIGDSFLTVVGPVGWRSDERFDCPACALEEAERLSMLNPGKRFYVMGTLSVSVVAQEACTYFL